MRPETVKNIIKEDRVPSLLEGYTLCLSEDCEVIYFGQQVFSKDDVKVKVWFKERDPFRPICYCAGVTEKDIIDHIVQGCCRDIKDIK